MSKTEQKIDMPPGVYARGEIADYDAIDAVNYSSLKVLAKSPKHYLHYTKNGARETNPMFKGTAAHVAILEPERFTTSYAVFPGKTRRGKAWDAFRANNPGRTLIKADEFAAAIALRDAVRADALASAYLSNGQHEVTLVWVDHETGLKLKGRVDWLRNDRVLVDVKTTRDATPQWFSRDVAKLMYHVQCSMYLDGLETLTGDDARFVVLAVESAAPNDAVTFSLPEATVGAGRDEYRRLLRLLIQCREEKSWPGIGNGFEIPLTLPAWLVGDDGDLEALGLEQ